MSDEWFYHGSPRRSPGGSWMAILVILLMIANVGVIAYTTIRSNQQVQDLNSQIGTLSTSIDILNAEVSNANAEISSLRSALSRSAVNVTVSTGSQDALLIDLYNRTRNSVVLITVEITGGTAEGSGFVYDTTGKIVTNYHVVEDALSITVTFIDGTIVDAEVLGTDPYSDVAVIKVDVPASMLKPLRLGDSSKLKVGESVVAIGNPYGLANTLTSGIVSAVGREMDSTGNYPIVDVIQTDAAINPGNSGGPLLNMSGEVVGINTAIPTETSRGIGFAVPSNTISRELPSLISKKGTYDHPYLGIQGIDLTPSLITANNLPTGTHGTLIIDVTTPGPSATAGLRGSRTTTVNGESTYIGGDVILGADGTNMKSFYDLIVYLQRYKHPNDLVNLHILRNGSEMDVSVKLGTRPAP